MADISQYLAALIAQKNQLAENLAAMGVETQQSEKLNTLVPKVLDIKQGSDFAVEGYYKDGYFYEDEECTKEIEPDYTKIYTDLNTGTLYVCTGIKYKALSPGLSYLDDYGILASITTRRLNTIGKDFVYYLYPDIVDNTALDIATGVETTFPSAAKSCGRNYTSSIMADCSYSHLCLGGDIVATPTIEIGTRYSEGILPNTSGEVGTYSIKEQDALILSSNLIWESIEFTKYCIVDNNYIIKSTYRPYSNYVSPSGFSIGTMAYTDKYYLLIYTKSGTASPYSIDAWDKNHVRSTVSNAEIGGEYPFHTSTVFNGEYAICVGGRDVFGSTGNTYIHNTTFAIDNNLVARYLGTTSNYHMINSLSGVMNTSKMAYFVGQEDLSKTSGTPYSTCQVIRYDKNLQYGSRTLSTPTMGGSKYGQRSLISVDDGHKLIGIIYNTSIDNQKQFTLDENGVISILGASFELPYATSGSLTSYGEHKGKLIFINGSHTAIESNVNEMKECHNITIG